MKKNYQHITLLVLDGWGESPENKGNAIAAAKKPYFDSLILNYPHCLISASADSVGLTWGEAGNSEVGHLNLGAGRVVWQNLSKIDQSISDGSFFKNKVLVEACNWANKNNSSLHLLGLVSPGGVHSHIEHLYALLKLAKMQRVERIYIHMITDGRDSPPQSALDYLKKLEAKIKEIGIGQIATIVGRYWAMDRNNHWERTQKAYDLLVEGQGHAARTPEEAIKNSYDLEVNDEFIKPTAINRGGKVVKIQDNDSVIFFNFRPDRARQLNAAFCDPNFDKFPHKKFSNLNFTAMAQFEKGSLIEPVAFPSEDLKMTLTEVIADNNLKQFHIAETEKYAHVTYFFNGGQEKTHLGEARAIIPSPQVATYDLKPEMSAEQVTEETTKQINSKKFALILTNFANPDMVGHTGDMQATIKAIEFLDLCIKKVVDATLSIDGAAIITADHGNAESMIDIASGKPAKDHSTNPVPLIIATPDNRFTSPLPQEELLKFRASTTSGILADVAPTILDLAGIKQPPEMEGSTLLGMSM